MSEESKPAEGYEVWQHAWTELWVAGLCGALDHEAEAVAATHAHTDRQHAIGYGKGRADAQIKEYETADREYRRGLADGSREALQVIDTIVVSGSLQDVRDYLLSVTPKETTP